MHRRIELLDKSDDVTVTRRCSKHFVQIGAAQPQPAALTLQDSGVHHIRLGQLQTRLKINVQAETVFIRAFGQVFDLRIVNPVEQAARSTKGGGNKAIAPMPGVVVDTHVAQGERILKGQAMMTIESMKILTTVQAPANGQVEKIHFTANQPFEKGAVLVTLCPEEQ